MFSAIVLLSVLGGDRLKKLQSVCCSWPSGDQVQTLKRAIVGKAIAELCSRSSGP